MKSRDIPARYVLAFMGFWGTFTAFMLKINISVAIVEMVNFVDFDLSYNESEIGHNFTTPETASDERIDLQCPDRGAEKYDRRAKNASETRFDWNGSQQGLVLGSYSYGVVALMIPLTALSRRLGHVRVQGYAMLLASTLTLIIPIAVENGGYVPFVVLRIFIGMFSGSTTSQMFGLAGIWAPPQERSKIISIMLAGIPLGVSCVMPLAGLLASTLGWKSIFYVTGAWGACWAMTWLIFIHERPEDHPRISHKELEYINISLNQSNEKQSESPKVPWLKILKSRPVICLVVVHFCSVYGRTKFGAVLPTYLKTVLKLDVETSGILSAVPFAVSGILLFACGPFADYAISTGMKTIYVRKLFSGIGLVISAVTVSGLAFCGCNIALVVTLSTIAVAMDAFVIPGFKACLLEVAPEYSGVIFGISATIANTTGILAPQITGLLRDAYGFLGWQIAFWISGIIYLFGAIEFCIFGTNEKQPWAMPLPKKSKMSVATITETI